MVGKERKEGEEREGGGLCPMKKKVKSAMMFCIFHFVFIPNLFAVRLYL